MNLSIFLCLTETNSFIQQFNNKGCLFWLQSNHLTNILTNMIWIIWIFIKNHFFDQNYNTLFLCSLIQALELKHISHWILNSTTEYSIQKKPEFLDKYFGNVILYHNNLLVWSCSVIKTLSKSHLTIAKIDGHFPGQTFCTEREFKDKI